MKIFGTSYIFFELMSYPFTRSDLISCICWRNKLYFIDFQNEQFSSLLWTSVDNMAIFLSFTVVNYLNLRRVIFNNELTDKINFFTLSLIAQLLISIFKIWNKVHSVNFTNRFWVTLPRYLHLKIDKSDKNNQHFFRRCFVTSHASSQILSLVSNPTEENENQGHPTSIFGKICSEDDLRSRIFGTLL